MSRTCVAVYGLVAAITSFTSASTRLIFTGSNVYVSDEIDETQVASILKDTVLHEPKSSDNKGILSTVASTTSPSEVMCLYLVPTLTLENMAQLSQGTSAYVENAVQKSMSSVVIPQTTRTKPLLPEISTVQLHVVEFEKLDALLASAEGQTLVSNGKTDLLVVQFPTKMSLTDVDDAIETASKTLLAASNGMTDFALTGNDVAVVELDDLTTRRLAAESKAKRKNAKAIKNANTNKKAKTKKNDTVVAALVCEANYLVGYSAAGKAFCFSHYVNITPEIMAGLLFGFLFIFMAYIGLNLLHQIQTPRKFPSQGAPRGKEF